MPRYISNYYEEAIKNKEKDFGSKKSVLAYKESLNKKDNSNKR